EIVKRQNDAAPAVAEINFSIQAAPLPDVPLVTDVAENGAGIGLTNLRALLSNDAAPAVDATLAPSGHLQKGAHAQDGGAALTLDPNMVLTSLNDDGSVGAPLVFPDRGQG